MKYHKPVLLEEIIEHLKVNKDKKYIDATLGDGGHTIEILKRGGIVLGIDVDRKSLERATKRIKELGLDKNFLGVNGNFKDIEEIAKKNNFENVNGILYDLGYSSYQVDESDLGISFQKDTLLDMRMDNSLGVTASDLVNMLSEKQLASLLREYSDERLSSRFARAIVNARSLKRIQTTKELVDIIVNASPLGYERGRIHPATRTFQALRIAVNDEMNNLQYSLPRAARLLLPGGVIAIISFHSKEDRLVKSFGQKAQPTLTMVTKKPIEPQACEIKNNVRARSAKLRVYTKQ